MNMTNVNDHFIGYGAASDTMQLMYDCFRSYLIHSHEDLMYVSISETTTTNNQSNAMNYSETVKVAQKENGRMGMPINCSTFVNLMLLGVPYEHSRYYKEDPDRDGHSTAVTQNDIGAAGYCCNLLGGPITKNNCSDIFDSQHLYYRFKALGRGFEPAADYSNVQPGDVLFWGYKEGADWKMKHVGIMLARMNYDAVDNNTPLWLYAHCFDGQFPIAAQTMSLADIEEGFSFRNSPKAFLCYIGRPHFETTCTVTPQHLASRTEGCNSVEFTFSNLYNREGLTVEAEWTPTCADEIVQVDGVNYDAVVTRGDGTAIDNRTIISPAGGVVPGRKYTISMAFPAKSNVTYENVSELAWKISTLKITATTLANRTVAVSGTPLKNIIVYRGVKGGYATECKWNERELDIGLKLNEGTDLNLLPIGKAYVLTNSVAATIQNKPATSANFTVWTFYRTPGLKSQVLIDSQGGVYSRSQYSGDVANGTYQAWKNHLPHESPAAGA